MPVPQKYVDQQNLCAIQAVTTESILSDLRKTTATHQTEHLVSTVTTPGGTEVLVVSTVTQVTTPPVGTRVKWHVTTPGDGKPLGTLFGRVVDQTQDGTDLLFVVEEQSEKMWALNPATDHITVLG